MTTSEGGLDAVASLIDSGEWRHADQDALVVARDTLERGADLYVFDTDEFVRVVERLIAEGVDLTDLPTLERRLNLGDSSAAQLLEFRSDVLRSPELEPPAVMLSPSGEPGGVILHTHRREPEFVRPRAHIEVPASAAFPIRVESRETVRRTPHIDLSSEALSPGVTFDVEVYADTAPARDDEQSEEIQLDDQTGEPLPLGVWLVTTSHFENLGSETGTITIAPDQERSSTATFKLAVTEKPRDLKRASITALFAHDGRPCGRVLRVTPLTAKARRKPRHAPTPPEPPTALRVYSRAPRTDLTIEIAARADGAAVRFPFKITTRHEDIEPIIGLWELPDETGALVKDAMGEFTQKNASNAQRIDALKGAGMELFNRSPHAFQALFWRLVKERRLPETIYIVSSEPYVPWELMVPNRELPDGSIEFRDPLGVEFVMGRWVEREHRSPAPSVLMSDSSVLAPTYAGERALKLADAEADFVCHQVPGVRLSPSDYAELKKALESRASTLVHFACHGASSATQAIYLDPNEAKLGTRTLRGMMGTATAFRKHKPLVFLNACEVARLQPALVGIGGFAEILIDAGASAVIAPLWSVRDSIAHDVALQFYDRVSDPTVRFADALRELRRKAYHDPDGEDTYAAYCFFGDPNAAQAAIPVAA